MAEEGVPGAVERRSGEDRRTGERRSADRRTGGSGGISLSGTHRQAQPGFFDRPYLVLGAIVAGIAIGVGIMRFTDSSRLHGKTVPTPVAASTAAVPQASGNSFDVVIQPEPETGK